MALGRDADGQRYEALAAAFRGEPHSPQLAFSAPWCFRVLVPGVAALLPVPLEVGFPAISWTSTALALWLLALLLQRWGLSWGSSVLGMLLYAAVFWSVKFSFYSPFYIDSVAQLLLLGTLYAWERKAYRVVTALLIVGVLAKESLALLLPVFAFTLVRSGAWAGRNRWFLLSLVSVAISLAIPRVFISALNEYSPEAALVQTAALQLMSRHFWSVFPLELVSGTGLLVILSFYGSSGWGRVKARPQLLGLLCIGVIQLFGGWDKGRLFLPLLPVLVYLALSPANSPSQSVRRCCWWVGTFMLHAYLGHLFTPMGTHAEYLRWLVPLHAAEPTTLQCWRVMIVIALWGIWTALLLPTRIVERR